jgi:hypothetical protein
VWTSTQRRRAGTNHGRREKREEVAALEVQARVAEHAHRVAVGRYDGAKVALLAADGQHGRGVGHDLERRLGENLHVR